MPPPQATPERDLRVGMTGGRYDVPQVAAGTCSGGQRACADWTDVQRETINSCGERDA